jgi:hypothetical protein
MTCCGSRNDFYKKSGARLIRAKGLTPVQRNRQELVQNSENNFEGLLDETRSDMCIPGGLLFMWGIVPNFPFSVLVATSQKNLISALQKWKTHFSWNETKIGLRVIPRHPKGHAYVRYGLVSKNYAMIRAKPSSFVKAMQPRTW